MILIRGWYKDTGLTGTLFEEGDEVPDYKGSANSGTPYTWVCDEFYRVESGGTVQNIDGEEIRVAFEQPKTKGYLDKQKAIQAAEEHIRTQFLRIGAEPQDVTFEYIEEFEEE